MTWGIPTAAFVTIHVVLSLIGIAAGFAVLAGLLKGKAFGSWTTLFLATTILTSVTGFPLPPLGIDPPRIVGVISLVLLALAVIALYIFRLAGAWRWIYTSCAIAALYLNVFVGVVQAFQKLPFLHPLAPTQSEPPFLVTQLVVLLIFVGLGIRTAMVFHPELGARRTDATM
ncbi:hypothetical protein LGH82_27555 [Mesorhizobium sp. PAMC28654]|uniref:hypothetical protein n=1 Tax=Mesorhizobium sp. PAMC28654 TaxID=2880934 RepID=UPI001D0BCEC1|nr:hypothetical protein [Mesorhizobium sp. PAMC28654]UDL88828.1 hypothetical protein LGH82_27555 [Mesorhizobium sp. PAMC28654]